MIGQKGMLSEGGIRVPFVAAWPGHIPAGQVYEHPGHQPRCRRHGRRARRVDRTIRSSRSTA